MQLLVQMHLKMFKTYIIELINLVSKMTVFISSMIESYLSCYMKWNSYISLEF
jgi:hypothetical protein